jgi:hypothetical protein
MSDLLEILTRSSISTHLSHSFQAKLDFLPTLCDTAGRNLLKIVVGAVPAKTNTQKTALK